MIVRAGVLFVTSIALSGCAGESPLTSSLYSSSTGLIPANLSGTAEVSSPGVPVMPPRKTMSDRVLAAIALERVTGRKPDPSRFND